MRIVMRMRSVKRRVIETTALDVSDGMALEDDFLNVSSLATDGLVLERCAFTLVDDGMMSLKAEPIVLAEPAELEDVAEVTADGKPVLQATEAGGLAPSGLESLLDEDGGFLGDNVRGLGIYYASGSYETVVPTVLHYPDGSLASDDLVDFSDLGRGITWDRGVWTKDDAGLMSLKPEAVLVVDADQLSHADAVTFNGELACLRDAEGLKCLLVDSRESEREGE